MTQNPQKFLFDVNDYYKMVEVGIIGHEDKVELINGEIVNVSPSNSLHAHVIDKLNKVFFESKKEALIRIQNPLSLNEFSELEPDVLIAKEKPYIDHHPTAEDVYLLIEVSESILKFDQTIKKDLYAQAGVPEYWIVNLSEEQIEAYSEIVDGVYQKCSIYRKGEHICGKQINLEFNMKDLFE